MTSLARAAWVPDDGTRSWDETAEVAVAWVERECAEQDATAVLVTNSVSVISGFPLLQQFAARHAHTMPQSRSRVPGGEGPVLAYVPTDKAIDLAMDLARRS